MEGKAAGRKITVSADVQIQADRRDVKEAVVEK